MSLPLFFGVLTLAPAVAALLIAGMGLAHRPIARVVRALTWLGALIPLAALIYLVADLASGVAQRVAIIGPAGAGTWLTLAYRYDGFAVYGAFGVAVVVAPLLLWMVARGHVTAEDAPEDVVGDELETDAPVGDVSTTAPLIADGTEADETANTPWLRPRAGGDWMERLLPLEDWAGFALVLGLESAALVLCFADALVWLALAWVALAALAWGVGEVGAEPGELDRRSLPLMLAGPVLWLVAMLVIAVPLGAARLSDLAGVGGASIWLGLLVCLFLALAGGAYPFNGWVRRRAMVTAPVGFAAVMLAALPAALFVGARTYAALQDSLNLWPQLGAATPPITIAIVLVLLGALTVAVSGLLALNFRDGRTLVALLASAQVGWGLLVLGIGRPLSAVALVALLATMVFGLGALVTALFAGGMLTQGEEPDGAGPQPFGVPLRPLSLVAWMLGATALLGVPLFGGFIARQLTAAASLTAAQLTIPLTGLAWVGDALLAIAVARATAPALFAKPIVDEPEADATVAPLGAAQPRTPQALPATSVVQPAEALAGTAQAAAPQRAAAEETITPDASLATPPMADDELDDASEGEDELEGDDDDDDEEEEEEEGDEELAGPARRPWGDRLREVEPAELPGLVLALLALVIGIAPGLLFLLGGLPAAQALLQPGTLDAVFSLRALGYSAGLSQWLPSLAWIAIAILLVLAALIREITRPAARLVTPVATPAIAPAIAPPIPVEAVPVELATLPEPGETWKELEPAFDSSWTVPGVEWLLHDLGEDDETDADDADDPAGEEALRALREAGRPGVGLDTGPTSTTPQPPGAITGGAAQNPQAAGTRGEAPGEQP